MFIEFIDRIGGKCIKLEVSQLLVRDRNGTPVCVAGRYGDDGMIVASATDPDFQQALRAFGYAGDVEVKSISLEPYGLPRGSRRLPDTAAAY
jgi:hypothetical protein